MPPVLEESEMTFASLFYYSVKPEPLLIDSMSVQDYVLLWKLQFRKEEKDLYMVSFNVIFKRFTKIGNLHTCKLLFLFPFLGVSYSF